FKARHRARRNILHQIHRTNRGGNAPITSLPRWYSVCQQPRRNARSKPICGGLKMGNAKIDTDVLIVGAGPVGLFLANECARRGLRWRLIESSSQQSIHSKALAIFPRTLEIFDMAGIVTPFLEAANRVTSVSVMVPQHTLARIPFTPEESPY